jgi:predicted CXXCH cytochrome family protein
MAGRKVPTDIVAKYRGSVHGRALLDRGVRGAPACNSCHGSHGAAKPKADAVANLCGECHDEQATLFRETRKRHVFDAGGAPECVVCHSNHDIQPQSDALVGTGPKSLCSRCHTLPDDVGTRDAKRLGDAFADVAPRIAATERGLSEEVCEGSDMRQAFLRLSEARRHLGRARVLIHSFDADPVIAELEAADHARQAADDAGAAAMSEWRSKEYFKYGAIAAVALGSIALILCVWFKVREDTPDVAVPRPAMPHD